MKSRKKLNYIEADAIIFDKDGTLLDFDAFWVPVTEKAVCLLLEQLKMQNTPLREILIAYGVSDGTTRVDGVLCHGTYSQMAEITYDILKKYGYSGDCDRVKSCLVAAYEKCTSYGRIEPTCPELAATIGELKLKNKRLAVVTTDNSEITLTCLKALGIYGLFDKVYTDDTVTPAKPNPYCLLDFCRLYGLQPCRTVMVGDTMTDVNFAKNAGAISVALVKEEREGSAVSSEADIVISKISELIEIIE